MSGYGLPSPREQIDSSKLAAELRSVRQRGVYDLDKRSHNQTPVEANGLEELADSYAAAHRLDLHGRIPRIARLLTDALNDYRERGNGIEADLIRDLLFDAPYDGAAQPRRRKSPSILLEEAHKKYGPPNRDRFDEWRRDAFVRFAEFLPTFVAEHTSPATAPPTPEPADGSSTDSPAATADSHAIRAKHAKATLAAVLTIVVGAIIAVSGLVAMAQGTPLAVDLLVFSSGGVAAGALSTVLAPRVERTWVYAVGGLWRTQSTDLRGRWRSTYRYASKGRQRTGVQLMEVRQAGRVVYAINIGGTSSHKHFIRMTIDGDFVTGHWRNTAKGAKHHGVLQLRVRASGDEMVGRWVGFDSDAGIQEGEWRWERLT